MAAAASVVGWVFAAIATIKQVLTFVGILGTAKDPVLTALQVIGKRVEAMYFYLADGEHRGLYKEAIGYRSQIDKIRNDIGNLALSRSDSALTSPSSATRTVRKSSRRTTGSTWPLLICMHRTDATSSGADYQDPSRDLAATIWDPGHYLDMLIQAIAVRLAALEATEPAYRSTRVGIEEI